MRRMLARGVLVGLALLLAAALRPHAGAAQSPDTLLAQAEAASARGDYGASAALFEQLTRRDRNNAEAFHRLARLYLETPLRDLPRSRKALKRALKLDKDNPRYLAVLLRQRQVDPAELLPPLQRERRRRLAAKILRLDAANAVAHLELGIQQADVFMLYDGAVTLKARLGGCANRFDVECLKGQGAAALDLSGEAEEAYPRALDHLQRAVAADPTLRPAYDHLMRLFAARAAYGPALALLDTMQVYFPDDAGAWRYAGWAHYHTDAFEAAAADFDRALGAMPPDERAAFDDLHFILHENQTRPYRQDPEAYAVRFWAGKDPRLLSPYNERRLEHFARLVHADILFGAPVLDRRGWQTDRGRIYLRYGAPPQRYLVRGTRFYASDNAQAYAAARRTGTFIIWEYDAFRFVFEDPESFMNNSYRLYSPSAKEYARSTLPVVEGNDYVIKAREVARREPERSQYAPPGGRLPMPFLASVFKGAGGQADVYVPFGLPDGLDADAVTTGVFLLDADHAVAARQRRSVDLGGVRRYAAHLHAPAGAYQLAVEFETAGGQMAGYERAPLAVPAFDDGALRVSDVMPALLVEEAGADASEEGVIVRHGYAVTAAPGAVFAARQPLYLYFEMYHLAQDAAGATAYAIEAVLVPWREDAKGLQKLIQRAFGQEKKEGVSVRFEGTGATPDEAHYLILDVADQPPGHYALGLRLHDARTGETVETSREVVLE